MTSVVMKKEKPSRLPRNKLHVGEMIGWRIWEIHPFNDEPTIRSWIQPAFWFPDIPMTDTTYENEFLSGPIDDHNERGVWAFKTYEECLNEFVTTTLLESGIMYSCLWGSCYMWGTVIEHELGYRAQYARIRGLDKLYGGVYDEDKKFSLDYFREKYKVGASPEKNND